MNISKLQHIYAIFLSFASAAMLHMVLFFMIIYMFSGENAKEWVEFYISSGIRIVLVTIVLSLPFYPIFKKLSRLKK